MSNYYIWNKNKLNAMEPNDSLTHMNHSLHYGNLIFEGIRFYYTQKGIIVFRLKDHIDRFFNSANILNMEIGINKKNLIDLCLKVIVDSGFKEGYLRPIAFFNNGLSGLNSNEISTDYAIIAWKWVNDINLTLDLKSKKLLLSNFIKLSNKHGVPQAKCSGNYLLSRMALIDSQKNDMDDAILLDESGYISEGTAQNIFFVKNNVIYTPSINNCLSGITRDTVINIAKNKGFSIVEDSLEIDILNEVNEVFTTSTASEITPIYQIYNKLHNKTFDFHVGGVTRMIDSDFKEIISFKNEKNLNWITLVQ